MNVVFTQDDESDQFKYSDGGIGLDDRYEFDTGFNDSGSEPDYTACSAHDCGYCGKCTY